MTAEKKRSPPKPQARTTRLSLFYGIAIEMWFDDHAPPHFHAICEGQEARVGLDNTLLGGWLPQRALQLVHKWTSLHYDELQDAWARCSRWEYPLSIAPLDRDESLVGPGHLYLMDVIAVEALEEYRIRVSFKDGVCGEVDLSHLAGQGVFQAWCDRAFFEDVFISHGTVSWKGEIDLDPCQLYMDVTGKAVEEVMPGLRPAYQDA